MTEHLTYSVLRGQIERDVVQCEKTVFIGKSSDIKSEYEFLLKNYPDIQFFMSTPGAQSSTSGMSFRHAWRSRVVKSFKRLTETGILTRTIKQDLSNQNRNRTPAIAMEKDKDFSPTNIATLRGTWPTVFILVGSLIGVTIPIFIIECRTSVVQLIENISRIVFLRHYRASKRITANNVLSVAIAVCEIGNNN